MKTDIFRKTYFSLTAGLSLFISLLGEFWKMLFKCNLESVAAVHILAQQLELL